MVIFHSFLYVYQRVFFLHHEQVPHLTLWGITNLCHTDQHDGSPRDQRPVSISPELATTTGIVATGVRVITSSAPTMQSFVAEMVLAFIFILHIYTQFYMYLSVCLSVYLPTYLPTCLPVYLSTCPPVYLSTCLPISLSHYLPICLSTYLSIYLSNLI